MLRVCWVCLLLSLCVCLGGAEVAPEWEFVRPGLSWRSWRGPGLAGQAVVLRMETRFWSVRSVRAQDLPGHVEGLAPLKDFRVKGAVAVVNGGFFDVYHRPMGLRVDRGEVLQPLAKRDWGVFAVTKAGRVGQVHSRDWFFQREVAFAVQSGPRLVVAGEALSMKPSVARRSVVAMDEGGHMLWVVCSSPESLGELARALATPTTEGGLGVREALALDGGPSTGLWVKSGAPSIPALSPVGDALVLVSAQ